MIAEAHRAVGYETPTALDRVGRVAGHLGIERRHS